MGKILIVAEKPSQAREYAKALGVPAKGEGFFQNDRYIITWCIGHLLELSPPETYLDIERVGKKWGLHRLPVLPALEQFRYQIKASTRSQYQVLVRLLQSPDVEKVICGTDADREGQLLFQEIWDRIQCRKPLERLWISSLTTEAIREGIRKLRPESNVQGLTQAGYGRSFGDWDFGMNLTEGFTALFGSFDPVHKKPNVISIGRVQTPTLALVVQREWEIEQFVPVQYCEIEAEFHASQGRYTGKWVDPASIGHNSDQIDSRSKDYGVEQSAGHKAEHDDVHGQKSNAESGGDRIREQNGGKSGVKGQGITVDRGLDRAAAERILAKIQGKPGVIAFVEAKEVQEPHPLLFDLTTLTVAASKRFGMSAEKVLKTAQALYEKKAITYPRTDCNYLPPDIVPKLPAHLRALTVEPYAAWVQDALNRPLPRGKRVINQITAHHAIIPTTEKIAPERLSKDERNLWDMIVRRFLSIWFPPARYETTVVLTQVEGEYFRTRGKVLIDLGWKKLLDQNPEEERMHSTRRKPPTRKDNDQEGDETDADFGPLPVLSLKERVDTVRVAVLEKETKPPKRYTQGDLIKAMENAGKNIEDEFLQQQLKGKGLGTVATRPAIIENLLDRGYLIQEQKTLRPTAKGIELIRLIQEELPKARLLVSAEMTGQMEYELSLVEQGKLELREYMAKVEKAVEEIIAELRAFESRFGKRPLSLAPTRAKNSGVKTEKPDQTEKPMPKKPKSGKIIKTKKTEQPDSVMNSVETLGSCPLCGGDVVEREKSYGCANWQRGCTFAVRKNKICGKVLTPSQVKKLLKKGSTDLIKGFRSKTGKTFSAYLVWDETEPGKLKFRFGENQTKMLTSRIEIP